jgi:hypothetical protein
MTGHFALAGHWVILAGLYLLFSPKSTFKLWLVLAVVSMLVQPYLAIICAALFFAWMLIAIVKTRAIFQFVRRMCIFIGVIFISGWSSGLFIFGLGSAQAAGFGTYSANALAWVDPGFTWYEKALWSRYVPDQWQNAGQYEGMNYLGSGVLLLAFVALGHQLIKGTWKSRGVQVVIIFSFVAAFGRSGSTQRDLVFLLGVLSAVVFSVLSKQFSLNKSTTVIYVLLFILLILIAFTYQIFIGDFLIANFTVPESINNLLSVVRTSGRMLWPVTFLITALLVAYISVNFRRNIATALLIGVLVIQTYDSVGAVGVTKSMFNRAGPTNYLSSPMWDTFGERYSKISIVLPNDNPILYPTHPDFTPPEDSFLWREIGMFAVKHRMQLNSFYFSREPQDQNEAESKLVLDQISSGKFDPNTLYVFIDADSWERMKLAPSKPWREIVENVPIIAP